MSRTRALVVRHLAVIFVLLAALFQVAAIRAAQIDVSGPAGSVAFGIAVTALPNGNVVVLDPQFANGATSNVGAVYLYTPQLILISTLSGSSTNDNVGNGGVVIVGGSNFVVVSWSWNNMGAAQAGAVTWVNGDTGLSGVVSASNSLVGTTTNDMVGSSSFGFNNVTVLSNGNYVVASPNWNSGVIGAHVGAATWGNGSSGITGPVSASNSLVGSTVNDMIGSVNDAIGSAFKGVTALSNGNYVVASPNWNNGVTNGFFGAVTWGDGSSGIRGAVSAGNSLIGTTTNDSVGGTYNGTSSLGGNFVVALNNGNYVVRSPKWNNSGAAAGAATWGNGSSGIVGPVSATNSLIGTTPNDEVSSYGVTALSNGNYVVNSAFWNNAGTNTFFGAATWGDGSSGITGAVSASNSLVGTTLHDKVGDGGIFALTNGNYVVASPDWNNGTANSRFGAATWGDGNGGGTGAVSASNSLIGSTVNDIVGGNNFFDGKAVTVLSDGNYVVCSPSWNNGVVNGRFGAATWGNGGSGITGPVSASNSLIGTVTNDNVGILASALNNGNYVVGSYKWNTVGAATWSAGSSGITGQISASNSLIGTSSGDSVGVTISALSNGNYVVDSFWSNGSGLGAVTWSNGSNDITGPVSGSNSLIGTYALDQVGSPGVAAFSDGNYAVISNYWNGNLGAVTLASGAYRFKGTIQPWNSVMGTAANGGVSMTYDYNPTRHEIIVGRPAENIVSAFTMDQIFAGDFEP